MNRKADFTPRQIIALDTCLGELPLSFWHPGDWPFLVLPVDEKISDAPDGWKVLDWREAVLWAKKHPNGY